MSFLTLISYHHRSPSQPDGVSYSDQMIVLPHCFYYPTNLLHFVQRPFQFVISTTNDCHISDLVTPFHQNCLTFTKLIHLRWSQFIRLIALQDYVIQYVICLSRILHYSWDCYIGRYCFSSSFQKAPVEIQKSCLVGRIPNTQFT